MITTVHGALRMLSDTLDDTEALRIATENRYRAATRDEADSDGAIRGLGLDDRHPVVAAVGATLDALRAEEHRMTLALKREIRKTPFSPWLKSPETAGVGEKQAARLLAAIGDPYLNESTGEPRTLRQLWAYTGHAVDGGSARRPRRGMSQEELFAMGSRSAKMRAYLVATSCVKAKGKFRAIYDAERERYADAVHVTDCVRCGPSGKPAPAGSPLSLGHQHARAVRRVAKEILRDLWLIARAHHEQEGGVQRRIDGQWSDGVALP